MHPSSKTISNRLKNVTYTLLGKIRSLERNSSNETVVRISLESLFFLECTRFCFIDPPNYRIQLVFENTPKKKEDFHGTSDRVWTFEARGVWHGTQDVRYRPNSAKFAAERTKRAVEINPNLTRRALYATGEDRKLKLWKA